GLRHARRSARGCGGPPHEPPTHVHRRLDDRVDSSPSTQRPRHPHPLSCDDFRFDTRRTPLRISGLSGPRVDHPSVSYFSALLPPENVRGPEAPMTRPIRPHVALALLVCTF